MFKNEFQGGNHFEIFNPTAKDPIANFKIVGSHGIQKIYDKEVRGSVFQLDGVPSTTKLTLPKNSREQLSLIQRCIVFQVYVKFNQELSMEIVITDLSQNRRNLLFSTSHKDLNVQPLSARIPLRNVNRGQWTNLVFDLASLINEIWKNQTFKSIDALTICANCKLRKIFTLKTLPCVDFALVSDDYLHAVNFPEGTDTRIQIFTINETKSNDENNVDNSLLSSRSKSQNVFKIAFGSKIARETSARSSQLTKSAKSQSPVGKNENQSLNLKSNEMGSINNENKQLTGRQKSELITNNNPPVKSSGEIKKTSWNQRAIKSSSNKQSQNLLSNDLNVDKSFSKNAQKPITNNNSNNQTDLIIQSNKIPHPPPQSTRPTSTSARKLRLSSAVKNNQQKQLSEQKAAPSTNRTYNFPNMGGGESSNEEDMINSSKTLIEYSPFKNKPTQNPKTEKNNDIQEPFSSSKLLDNNNNNNALDLNSSNMNENITDLIEALKAENQESIQTKTKRPPLSQRNNNLKRNPDDGNNVNYSFSSRPKPAPFVNGHDHHEKSFNSNSGKVYDYRRYSSSTALNQKEETSNENSNPKSSVPKIPWVTDSIVNDSLNVLPNANSNIINQIGYEEVMDSFEANMLRELKEEMASDTTNNTNNKHSSKKSSNTSSHLKGKTDSGVASKTNSQQTSSNGVYIDEDYAMMRDNSGLQSPFSDDYNQTTSEKYNFDAITSSIDDTTTSMSKKTPSRNAKYNENNYQDEMNFSLQIQSKSINLKDLPSKYSPLLSQTNGLNSRLQNNPITEEPPDDSQADIDEIGSDSEDEVDLLYDPGLNCYYDPKTSTYYELNLGQE